MSFKILSHTFNFGVENTQNNTKANKGNTKYYKEPNSRINIVISPNVILSDDEYHDCQQSS